VHSNCLLQFTALSCHHALSVFMPATLNHTPSRLHTCLAAAKTHRGGIKIICYSPPGSHATFAFMDLRSTLMSFISVNICSQTLAEVYGRVEGLLAVMGL